MTSEPTTLSGSVSSRDIHARGDNASASFAGGDTGMTLPSLATFKANPDLAVIAGLLLLTALFSRGFSQAIQIGPFYVTELAMGISGLIALVRLRLTGTVTALRRLPLIALAIIWLAGAWATARGLRDYTFSFVSDDIGLVDYSLLLPLFAMVVFDRERHEAMFAVLVGCGFVGIIGFAATFIADNVTGRADALFPLQGQAAGLYMGLAVSWIAARLTHGVPTPKWLVALLPVTLVLMGLTTQRSVWIIVILSLGAVVALAPPTVRVRAGIWAVVGFLATFAIAIGVQEAVNSTLGGVAGRTETSPVTDGTTPVADSGGGDEGGGGGGESQSVKEVTSLGGGSSAEADNVRWRLAYWKELLGRVPSDPIAGIGFGQPAAFVWNDRKYDFRDGDPGTGLDVAGPHNSFVSFVYRLGIPAFLALLFVLFVALRNVWRAIRRGVATGERVALVSLVAMLGGGVGVSLFNESLTGPFLGMFFWIPLAMLLIWPATRGSGGEPAEPAGSPL